MDPPVALAAKSRPLATMSSVEMPARTQGRPVLVHEDSNLMSEDDFFDAKESVEGEGSRHTVSSDDRGERSAARVSSRANGAPHGRASAASSGSERSPSVSSEEKYIVRNKDTGEVYDIRTLVDETVDSYTIFPTNFQGPVDAAANEDEKHTKTRRPSLTKLKIKFPLKAKAKDHSRRNSIPVLASKKDRRDFDEVSLAQSITKHTGTIWTMKFSHDGARLASGGQDTVLRVWKVAITANDHDSSTSRAEAGEKKIIEPDPEQSYQGHTMPIVDVSWSRSNFILSASMDKTVRLWHISRPDCLHVFQHPDSVPAVDFHPKEDRYFLSGCFDNKARVWDIPEGCVVSYVQTPAMITAASFNPGGTRAIVGLLNGQCIFYQVNSHQQMTYYTQIECRNSRGPMKKGRKVTGIEFDPEGKYFMVSTNDSRMRLFSVDNYSRICKYKGLVNDHLQIKGRFSQDGDFVICGSENGQIYIWNKASYMPTLSLMKSLKHDRNASYEHFCAAEPPNGIVTIALFAPASTYAMVKSKLDAEFDDVHANPCTGLIVSATYDGCIKFFERLPKAS